MLSNDIVDFLIILKQKIQLLQEWLKIEIRHKLTLIKQVAYLQKENKSISESKKAIKINENEEQFQSKYWH